VWRIDPRGIARLQEEVARRGGSRAVIDRGLAALQAAARSSGR